MLGTRPSKLPSVCKGTFWNEIILKHKIKRKFSEFQRTFQELGQKNSAALSKCFCTCSQKAFGEKFWKNQVVKVFFGFQKLIFGH